MSSIYQVSSNNVLVRSEPIGVESTVTGTVSKGTNVVASDEQNGFIKTEYGWISANQLRLVSVDGQKTRSFVNRSVENARASGGMLDVINPIVLDAYEVIQASRRSANNTIRESYNIDTTLDERLLENANAMCKPPQFCKAADPQVFKNYKIGRVYAESVLSHAIIVSICPCKVKYLPTFSSEEQKGFFSDILSSGGDASMIAKVTEDYQKSGGAGNFYEAAGDWASHINKVNAILRTASVFLGIGDLLVPGTTTKYKHFSWDRAWGENMVTDSGAANPGSSSRGFLEKWKLSAGSLLSSVATGFRDGVIADGTFLHFYADGDNTSYTDDHQNTTRSSMIESALSSVDEIVKEFNFLAGEYQNSPIAEDVDRAIDGLGDNWFGNILKTGRGYFEGARLAFPQILDTSTFQRSISVNLKCVAPNATPEAIFLYTMVPMAHVMALSMPGQYSANMYTFPPIVKINCTGWFNCDLAVISDLRITRGGNDSRQWTNDRLAQEIDISFSVTPLYSQLMIPTARKPFSALFNRGFMEYIGSITGIEMKTIQATLKWDLMKMMIGNKYDPRYGIGELIRGIGRSWTDKVANSLDKLTKMP